MGGGRRSGRARGRGAAVAGLVVVVLTGALPALAVPDSGDTLVTVGSPATHFPRNKQNEPAVAIAMDAAHPNILAAGANEEIDEAPCVGSSCPFVPGIGNSGIYFSLNGGQSWIQPTYRGWTARNGTTHVGQIGTIPGYYERGLVSDGDPALAFGPRPGPTGFSYANGSRLYYANLTSNFPGKSTIPAAEGIAVSRTDDVQAAAAGDASAWRAPVIASTQLTHRNIFSDKEALWADNAASSKFFGNVYVCWTSYRGTAASPVLLARSTDGGDHWSKPILVAHGSSTAFTGPSFCTVRTDSKGTVYVFYENGVARGVAEQKLARSYNGGASFDEGSRVVAKAALPGRLDPAHVAVGDPRFTMDGLAGAREDAGLSADIANGAPSGRDATNQIVVGWSDGRRGLNNEISVVQMSANGGQSWSRFVNGAVGSDRPSYTAVAISPNGTDVYVAYDSFLKPWQRDTRQPRPMQGVVRHADVRGATTLGAFSTLHRGAIGDARGASQNSLTSEFLGDYNYVMASRTAASAVWNDVRGAADCPAIDRYRASLVTAHPLPAPAPLRDCPPRFGNSDIYGGTYADPTP